MSGASWPCAYCGRQIDRRGNWFPIMVSNPELEQWDWYHPACFSRTLHDRTAYAEIRTVGE